MKSPSRPSIRRRVPGFNLVESLVALATIGVLAVIMIPVVKVYIFGERPAGSDASGRARLDMETRDIYERRFSDGETEKPAATAPAPEAAPANE